MILGTWHIVIKNCKSSIQLNRRYHDNTCTKDCCFMKQIGTLRIDSSTDNNSKHQKDGFNFRPRLLSKTGPQKKAVPIASWRCGAGTYYWQQEKVQQADAAYGLPSVDIFQLTNQIKAPSVVFNQSQQASSYQSNASFSELNRDLKCSTKLQQTVMFLLSFKDFKQHIPC